MPMMNISGAVNIPSLTLGVAYDWAEMATGTGLRVGMRSGQDRDGASLVGLRGHVTCCSGR